MADSIIIFLGIAVFGLIIFLTPLEFRIRYKKHDARDQLVLSLKVWEGLWGYQFEVPVAKWKLDGDLPYLKIKTRVEEQTGEDITEEEKVKITFRGLKEFKKSIGLMKWVKIKPIITGMRRVTRLFLRRVAVRKLKWKTEIGFFDAADTGTIVGLLWMAKTAFINRVRRRTGTMARPVIQVMPNFGRQVFALDFDCIFTVRIGDIIIAGYRIFWVLLTSIRLFKGVKR